MSKGGWNIGKQQWKESNKKEAYILKLHGGEKWASGWHNDRRTGYVQHSGSSHWKSYWSEELLETYQAFSEDHLEIKWKASCKYHGKQTWIKIKYFEESKSNVNTI